MTHRIKLVGHTATVHRNGITWVCPDDGVRCLIGKTRKEAEAFLMEWRSEKIRVRAPAPVAVREKSGLTRDYKRSLYFARARARRAGLQVLTMQEFEALVARAGGRCEVSGIRFSMERAKHHRKAMWSPSIDRIDNSRGYEADNCRLVCVAVNLALNEFGEDVLTRIAISLLQRRDPEAVA